MEVNRSAYYRWKQSPRRETSREVVAETRLIHRVSRGSYGSRRLSQALKAKGYAVGRYQARSLMKTLGLRCRQRRAFKVTTDSRHVLPIAENHLNRQFRVERPNGVWVTDITYIPTQEGWLFLAAVLDLFSRRIVGWSLTSHMRQSLVEDALAMALGRRKPTLPLMHHSDRGIQYANSHYRYQLQTRGITVSMSRKGNCWDNAVMERFWGSLKAERVNGNVYLTREHAKSDIIDYIEMFYNSERLHSYLGYVSPAEYEKRNQSLFL
jgi:putative transposase